MIRIISESPPAGPPPPVHLTRSRSLDRCLSVLVPTGCCCKQILKNPGTTIRSPVTQSLFAGHACLSPASLPSPPDIPPRRAFPPAAVCRLPNWAMSLVADSPCEVPPSRHCPGERWLTWYSPFPLTWEIRRALRLTPFPPALSRSSTASGPPCG